MPSTTMPAGQATAGRKEGVETQRPGQGGSRNASDDEILGLLADTAGDGLDGEQRDARAEKAFESGGEEEADAERSAAEREAGVGGDSGDNGDDEKRRTVFESNPELKKAWDDAQAYREAFATPAEARNATALLADLNRMDALFYSKRPEDHAELARSIAGLDAGAFASLAKAIAEHKTKPESAAADGGREADAESRVADVRRQKEQSAVNEAGMTRAQGEFFQAANAAAVQGVLDAIETQVERLLPEGASKNARNRVVGEIYRELDATLGANRQLSQQVREAFRSGGLDANHQRAIVSLITGRARQALPGVAKRVMNEWTSTIVAANRDRRARQNAAERRVDIAGASGGGGEGRRSMGPRDIDYARLSDGDILNL